MDEVWRKFCFYLRSFISIQKWFYLKNDLIQKYKYPKFLLNFISFKIRTSNGEFIVAKLDKKLQKAIIEDIK